MLGLYVYIYTSNLSAEPWSNAVQPTFNPAGSGEWYINLGKVAASRRVFYNVCDLQKYDTGGYSTYGGSLCPMLLIDSNNMYAHVGPKTVWSASAAILRIHTVLNV